MLLKDGSEFLIHKTQSCNSSSFSPEEIAKRFLQKVLPSNMLCNFSGVLIPQGDDEQGGVAAQRYTGRLHENRDPYPHLSSG